MSEITREQFSSAVAAAASSVYHLFRQVDRLTDEIKNGLAEATHPLALVPGVLSKSGRSSARMELRNEYGMLFGPAPTDEEEPDEEDEETDEGEDDLQQARKKKGPAEMMPDQRWLAVRIAIYDPQKQDAAEPRIEFGVVGDWRVGGAKPKPDEPIRLARHMLKRIPRALARGGSFAKGTQLETRATAKVDTGRKGGDARRLTCRLLVGGDAVALYEMDKPGAVQELVGRMKAMWEEASRPEPE